MIGYSVMCNFCGYPGNCGDRLELCSSSSPGDKWQQLCGNLWRQTVWFGTQYYKAASATRLSAVCWQRLPRSCWFCHLSCVQSIKQTNKYFESPIKYGCGHSDQTLVEKFMYQLRLKTLCIKVIGFANSLQLYLKIKKYVFWIATNLCRRLLVPFPGTSKSPPH